MEEGMVFGCGNEIRVLRWWKKWNEDEGGI